MVLFTRVLLEKIPLNATSSATLLTEVNDLTVVTNVSEVNTIGMPLQTSSLSVIVVKWT